MVSSCISNTVTLVLAKAYLILSSITCLGLSSAMIAVGSRRIQYDTLQNALRMHEPWVFLIDPYLSVLALGACSIPLCITGLAGGFWGARHTLLMYVCGVLVCVCLLIYVAILCFVNAQADTRLGNIIVAYFNLLATTVDTAAAAGYESQVLEKVTDEAALMLNKGGSICIACAVLLMAAGASASRIASHAWMSTHIGIILDSVSLCIASLLIYVGKYANAFRSSQNTKFALASGALTFLGSVLGITAFVTHNRTLINAHAVFTAMLVVLLAAAAAACIAAGGITAPTSSALRMAGDCTSATNSTGVCAEAIILESYASTHLLTVGAFAAIVATISGADLFATIMIIYTRQRRLGKTDTKKVDIEDEEP
jgi:hypothetical protein